MGDWYRVVAEDVIELGGSRLLRGSSTSSSLAAALQDAYPEHNWSRELFATKDGTLLSDPTAQREWFIAASEKLFGGSGSGSGSAKGNTTDLEKWYGVKSKDVLRLKGASFITHRFVSFFPENPG